MCDFVFYMVDCLVFIYLVYWEKFFKCEWLLLICFMEFVLGYNILVLIYKFNIGVYCI